MASFRMPHDAQRWASASPGTGARAGCFGVMRLDLARPRWAKAVGRPT